MAFIAFIGARGGDPFQGARVDIKIDHKVFF
jgi:hypothetical protein